MKVRRAMSTSQIDSSRVDAELTLARFVTYLADQLCYHNLVDGDRVDAGLILARFATYPAPQGSMTRAD